MSGELPLGWTRSALSGLGTWGSGGTPSRNDPDAFGPGVPWLKIGDLTDGPVRDAAESITTRGLASSAAKLLDAGTLLVAMYGSIGKLGITTFPCATNQAIASCVPGPGVDLRYLFYALLNERQRLLSLGQGGTQLNISQTLLKAHEINVAPLNEQQRIVSRIEELFSEIDEGERALERVGQLVERYRQSVLKAAVTGELTGAWQIVARSADEHKGLQEAAALPIGWRWASLAELVDEGPTNGYSPKADPEATGSLSLKLTATTSGKLRLDSAAVKRVNEVIDPESPLWLRPGDLLIQRANSLEHVGVAAMFDGPSNSYIYPDLMMRVRVHDPLLRAWLCRCLNSPSARQYFRSEATGTAGSMPKISGKVVKALKVPLPPPTEMRAALTQLDGQSTSCDLLKSEVQRRQATAAALRQSILKAAFSGQLVPQDPNDEPASALLARLAAQAAEAPAAPRRRGRATARQPSLSKPGAAT
jgi:type I restriction enzyme, S subunit